MWVGAFLHNYILAVILLLLLPSLSTGFVRFNSVTPRSHQRKVHVSYPVVLLPPVVGNSFTANVTQDKLTCFGNRDYAEPNYSETLLCILPVPPLRSLLRSCESLWGSRSVVVEAWGSVEFLKTNRLPQESLDDDDFITLNVTRWMELMAPSPWEHQRELKQVPAEPLYLCARSNDWSGADARFSITFRPGYLREKDFELCMTKTLLHIAIMLSVSSAWLLPYLAALVMAAVAYSLGMNKFIMTLSFSGLIVCLTPLMLTRKNRHLARLYLRYFFTRIQAEETRMVIRQRLPVFQALFFSSVVMCVGSAAAYLVYVHIGIDREARNTIIKLTMSFSASWFVFFLCRSFERFCRDWVWLLLSVGLAQLLDGHLNPMCRDELVIATMVITFAVNKLVVPRVIRVAKSNARMSRLFGSAFAWSRQVLASRRRGADGEGAAVALATVIENDTEGEFLEQNRGLDALGFAGMGAERRGDDGDADDDDDDADKGGADAECDPLNQSLSLSEMLDESRDEDDLAQVAKNMARSRRRILRSRRNVEGKDGRAVDGSVISRLGEDDDDEEDEEGDDEDYEDEDDEDGDKAQVDDSMEGDGIRSLHGSVDNLRASSGGASDAGRARQQLWQTLRPRECNSEGDSKFLAWDVIGPEGSDFRAAAGSSEELNRMALQAELGEDLTALAVRSASASPALDAIPGSAGQLAAEQGDDMTSYWFSTAWSAGASNYRATSANSVSASASTIDSAIDESAFPRRRPSSSASIQQHQPQQQQGADPAAFPNLVGRLALHLSAFGPLDVDSQRTWVPIVSGSSELLDVVRRGADIMKGVAIRTHYFQPQADWVKIIANLRFRSVSHAVKFQGWVATTSNRRLLESIVSRGFVAQDGISVSAKVAGRAATLSVAYCISCIRGTDARAMHEKALRRTQTLCASLREQFEVEHCAIDPACFSALRKSKPSIAVEVVLPQSSMLAASSGLSIPRLVAVHGLCKSGSSVACEQSRLIVVSAISAMLASLGAAEGPADLLAAAQFELDVRRMDPAEVGPQIAASGSDHGEFGNTEEDEEEEGGGEGVDEWDATMEEREPPTLFSSAKPGPSRRAVGTEASEASAAIPPAAAAQNGDRVLLTLTMPSLCESEPDSCATAGQASCRRMLLGVDCSMGRLPRLAACVALVAYTGFLAQLNQSAFFEQL